MKLLILILFLVYLPFTIGYSNPDKQIHCLAEAIYFESRGEPFIGMVAVGQVIIQPTRTAEFIVLDFTVQRSGAAFPE